MPVLAVVNAKGGSGKSTVAATISAYAANAGVKLMLGDLDPQQSVRTWLRLRPPQLPTVTGWLVDGGRVFRPPAGITHAILDTPSGLNGLHLSRIVMASNVVLVPVAASAFDRDATADCIKNLLQLPRIASGQCRLACVGMRMHPGSTGENVTRKWAAELNIPMLGVVRYAQAYVSCVDQGSSVFDKFSPEALTLQHDWKAVLSWLATSFFGASAHNAMAHTLAQRTHPKNTHLKAIEPTLEH